MVRVRLSSILGGLVALLIGLPTVAGAQAVLLRADRMLDVERGEIVSPAVVLVENGVIVRVSDGPQPVPKGGEAIDLGDVTLLPGLMDAHTHLILDLDEGWVHRGVEEHAADWALRGARNAKLTLDAGFTTIRDLGGWGFADVALARAIERGFVEGPQMLPAAHSLSITGGHCDTTGYAPGIAEKDIESGVADGVSEVLRATRYQIKHGAKVIKVCATAGVLSFEGPVGAQQFAADELRTAVEEAERHGMKVAAHAHGSVGILAAVEAGVASIEHGSVLTDEILEAMKARGTYLVPTSYLADSIDLDALPPPIRSKAEFILPKARESLRRAIDAGVPVAYGTDAGVYPHGDNAKEFAVLVERGMSPLDAIRTATLNTADLFGLTDRGRIAEGLRADLIAVPGNPLERIEAMETVVFVMKAGTIHKR